MIDYRASYFQWMSMYITRVDAETEYTNLIVQLANTEFLVSPLVPMDENRKQDGRDLRYKYAWQMSFPDAVNVAYVLLDGPVSILEVLLALSIKAEETTTYNGIEDHTHIWFWEMLTNIGLTVYNDYNYYPDGVAELLRIFMTRSYASDGSGGGAFVFDNPPADIRTTELWYQMNWYAHKFQ